MEVVAMLSRIKNFIKELQYKRFERKVFKEIRKGNTTFGFAGFEFEVKERND